MENGEDPDQIACDTLDLHCVQMAEMYIIYDLASRVCTGDCS